MIKKVARRFSSVRMQLVASVFVAIMPALVLTYIVNQSWFWQFAPEWVKQYALDVPWASFTVGLLALGAAWYGGEHFILRQVRVLSDTILRLGRGDLSARTGLQNVEGEFGQLAKTFDVMAESLQQRNQEREAAEKMMLNRALQQTVLAALGQFALTKNDLGALLNQAVLFVAQTLEVEYCGIFELLPDGRLLLQAGSGWKSGATGTATISADEQSQAGSALKSGESVVIPDVRTGKRFAVPAFFTDHGVVGSVMTVILTREKPFGIFSVCTTRPREFTADETQFLLAIANTIGMSAEHKRTDADLKKLAAFTELYPNPAMELNRDGDITYFNEAAQNLAVSVQLENPQEVMPPHVRDIVRECLDTGQSKVRLETRLKDRTFSWSFHPAPASNVVHCYVEDMTNRLNLEAQLRQAQKMESVGQLAAGVAHDFNNMLTIIQGHSSLLLSKAKLPEDVLDQIQAVYFAAERAAGLTRQLLMFSRKNVMQLKPLDLREVLGNMSKMLKRLLGETIVLEFQPPADLPLVQGDSGMLEQVVMNLSVNARDAMPKGGTLTIGVEVADIHNAYTQTHPEARTGRFVRLRVTDGGTGMDSATLARVFEPFFTTKEVGRGTGLGLATVYGITKQHEGWIEVTSELGKGTTFDVFLPATEATAQSIKDAAVPHVPASGGNETILIVEDEAILRDMARDILQEHGYRIIEAGSGKAALGVWDAKTEKIDLLLTDMVMPEGVSGVELAERLLAKEPGLRVIYTSGYTANEISAELLARTNACFLQKPYTHDDLAKIVRKALDGTPPKDQSSEPTVIF